MSGATFHPASDGNGKLRISDIITSTRDGRVCTAPVQDRTYYIRGTNTGLECLCLNKKGALCWRRTIEERRARSLIQRSVDHENTIKIGSYSDDWPNRFKQSTY